MYEEFLSNPGHFPIVEGNCGSDVPDFLLVSTPSGAGMLLQVGVTLYYINPTFHGFPSFVYFPSLVCISGCVSVDLFRGNKHLSSVTLLVMVDCGSRALGCMIAVLNVCPLPFQWLG